MERNMKNRVLSTTKIRVHYTLVLAMLLSTPPLHAARTVVIQSISFHHLDLNRSGYIERHEAASRPEFTNFLRKADTNHDGRLSKEEFDTAQNAMGG